MSTKRAFDVASSSVFDAGLPLRTSSNFIGTIISEVGLARAMSISIIKPGISGGAPADTFLAVLQEADKPHLAHHNSFDGVDDGFLKLRGGANVNTNLAIPFSQVGDRTSWTVGLWLSVLGAPALAAGGNPSITIGIYADNGGQPAVSPEYGATIYLDPSTLTQVPRLVLFGMQNNGILKDLQDGSDYWIQIDGDYDEDALNCVLVHYNTVVGTSGCLSFDGVAWNAIVNNDIWFRAYQLEFADVPADEIDGGAFDEYVYGTTFLNGLDSAQVRHLDLTRRLGYLRMRYEISGGNWAPFTWATFAEPHIQPLISSGAGIL